MAIQESTENSVVTPRDVLVPETSAVRALERPRMMPAAFDFSPRNLGEAMSLADRLAESTMVPKAFQGNPGNCLVAMQWGAELGLKPLQALQNIAVINGKPGLYGDSGKALLLNAGCQIIERDVSEIKSLGEASCTIQRAGRHPVTRTFSIEDAKVANLWGKEGPWRTYPYRQMAWRAFWFAARDAAADILRGMGGVEELADITETEPAPTPTAAEGSKSERLAAGLRKVTVEDVLAAFDAAQNAEAIHAAVEKAKKLTDPDDRTRANAAYQAAVARVRPPRKESGPTAEGVRKLLGLSTNQDDVDVATSMIAALDCDEATKDALREEAAARWQSLKGGETNGQVEEAADAGKGREG